MTLVVLLHIILLYVMSHVRTLSRMQSLSAVPGDVDGDMLLHVTVRKDLAKISRSLKTRSLLEIGQILRFETRSLG